MKSRLKWPENSKKSKGKKEEILKTIITRKRILKKAIDAGIKSWQGTNLNELKKNPYKKMKPGFWQTLAKKISEASKRNYKERRL